MSSISASCGRARRGQESVEHSNRQPRAQRRAEAHTAPKCTPRKRQVTGSKAWCPRDVVTVPTASSAATHTIPVSCSARLVLAACQPSLTWRSSFSCSRSTRSCLYSSRSSVSLSLRTACATAPCNAGFPPSTCSCKPGPTAACESRQRSPPASLATAPHARGRPSQSRPRLRHRRHW